MPFPVELPKPFNAQLADASRPQVGMWISSGSSVAAEIVASAGFDWVLVDGEHSPYSLETITTLLRAVSAYDATPMVRLPVNDTVLIKQYLDLGGQNLMIPMVDSAQEAEAAVAAMHYPPRGVRGVGSALARSSRWNAVPNYLTTASETLSLTVQIESAEAVKNADEILAVDGVDAVFIGLLTSLPLWALLVSSSTRMWLMLLMPPLPRRRKPASLLASTPSTWTRRRPTWMPAWTSRSSQPMSPCWRTTPALWPRSSAPNSYNFPDQAEEIIRVMDSSETSRGFPYELLRTSRAIRGMSFCCMPSSCKEVGAPSSRASSQKDRAGSVIVERCADPSARDSAVTASGTAGWLNARTCGSITVWVSACGRFNVRRVRGRFCGAVTWWSNPSRSRTAMRRRAHHCVPRGLQD